MLTQDVPTSLSDISDLNRLKTDLNQLPAIDVGEYIADLPSKHRAIAFRLLNKGRATDVFEYLEHETREDLIGSLHDAQVCQLVEGMCPDDRAELFDELPAGVVRRLIQQLSPLERQATATILGYPEGTAGRVMTTEYVRLQQGLTVAQALDKIRRNDQDKETIYYAYVTDNNRKLYQVVSLRQLFFARPDVRIQDIASDRVIKAYTETRQEEAAQIMKRYDLLALPVVDREDRLVGIVTIDDVVDILEDEATEDMQRFAGGSGDEMVMAPVGVTIRKRLPWLLLNIALYIGAASAIAPFQSTIAIVPVLAVIMPILANSSGNAAFQVLSVTVRGLGVGDIAPKDTWRILQKELLVGLGIAVALGLALGLLSMIWSSAAEWWVAIVAMGVMTLNVMIAYALGTVLPMVLKRFDLDPALISGPLLTTTLDTIGFLLFLSATTFTVQFLQVL